mmetsp:Transcript_26776/g.58372  ORF Transcript_26776/g.58372 Transcript_26776/m.58372 type:complete len:1072 (-) Transcript_26776:90-3305(-)
MSHRRSATLLGSKGQAASSTHCRKCTATYAVSSSQSTSHLGGCHTCSAITTIHAHNSDQNARSEEFKVKKHIHRQTRKPHMTTAASLWGPHCNPACTGHSVRRARHMYPSAQHARHVCCDPPPTAATEALERALSNACRCCVQGGAHLLVTSQHSDGSIGVNVHDDDVTLLDVSRQDALRQAVLNEPHDGPAQGAGTVRGVEALVHQPVLELLSHLNLDALLLGALEHVLEENVRDLLDLLLGQLAEHNDLIQTVQELRSEVALELLVHQGLDAAVALVLLGLLVIGAQEEAKVAATLLNHAGTHVGGHDDERVLEVNGAALAVCQAAVLQNLKHHVEHVGVRLLNLIKQHHGVWPTAHSLGQLPTLLVANVARWGTNQLGNSVALHELRHIQADHGLLTSKVVVGQGLSQLGLTHTGGTCEDEGGNGPVGVLQADTSTANGAADGGHGLLLANHAAVQHLLHLDQALSLIRGHLLNGDAGPLGHNGGNVLLSHSGATALHGLSLCLALLLGTSNHGLDLGLELHLAVTQLAGLLKVLAPDCAVLLLDDGLELLVQVACLLRQLDVAQPHPGAGLINQIDGLVGQEAVRDVLGAVLGGSHQGLISVAQLVVSLVALAQTLQNLEGLIDGGLRHVHWLETALQRRVLLNVLAVLIKGGGTNALQLATSQGGLQDVGCINGTLSGTSSDQGVHLINHQNDVVVLLDLIHELLQTLLKLTTVLGTGNQQTHVKGDDLLALNGLRHVTVADLLGQTLSHGGLAHTRLTDKARVVLGTTTQNLDHTLNLLLAAHHGIQLALGSLLGEVSTVLLQGGHLVGASSLSTTNASTHSLLALTNHADDLGANLGRISTKGLQHARSNALTLTQEAQQDVLSANVVVTKLASLLQGHLQHPLSTRGEWNLHSHKTTATANNFLNLHAGVLQVHTHALQHLCSNASALADQAQQKLLSAHKVVAQPARLLLCKHDHLDGLFGEPLKHSLDSHSALASPAGPLNGRPSRAQPLAQESPASSQGQGCLCLQGTTSTARGMLGSERSNPAALLSSQSSGHAASECEGHIKGCSYNPPATCLEDGIG